MSKKRKMLTCTIADIKLMGRAGATFIVQLIPIRKKKDIWYKVEFTMTPAAGGKTEDGVLMTVRHVPYTRASLDLVATLLRDVFPTDTKFEGTLFPHEEKKPR